MITPIFIPISSGRRGPPPPPPKCPHCKEELPGWEEPSDCTGCWKGVIAVIVILAQIVAFMVGGMEGSFDRCEPFGTKRYHYAAPAYVGGCAAIRYMTNKKKIFEDKEDLYSRE